MSLSSINLGPRPKTPLQDEAEVRLRSSPSFKRQAGVLLARSGAILLGVSLAVVGVTRFLDLPIGLWSAPLDGLLIAGIGVPLLAWWVLQPATRSLERQACDLQVTVTREEALREALRQSEEKYRTMVEHVPAVTYMAAPDPADGFLYISPQIETLVGYGQKELYYQRSLWWDRVHPEDVERLRVARAAALLSDQPLRIEYRVWTSESRQVWLRDEAVPVRDDTGAPTMMQGVLLDISEAKRAEETLRERDEQLRQSQKMEAIGRLAGGVAHDFNNMLAVINGYSEMLLTLGGIKNPMLRGQLEEIHRAGERAAGLTKQLLAFSRTQVLSTQILDVNEVIQGARKMLERLIGEDIFFEINPGEALERVKADPGQVEQVLMNLAVNARDAMPQGGTLRIRTRNVTVTEGEQEYFRAAPGDYVEISVTDTGCGMDEEVRSRIFEPFFTTKERGKGTGLGLATVYGIVHQTGGHMSVDSAPGLGTTFRIYLPVCREEVERLPEVTGGSGAGGSETILVVEDEEMVRKLIASYLEQRGYRVLTAESGERALAALEELRDPVDLVLSDVVMPGISGPETVQWMRRRYPDIRVLFMSGYTHDLLRDRGIDARREDFLQKPFTPDQLGIRVRNMLDAAAVLVG